jgi:hypothetical protein
VRRAAPAMMRGAGADALMPASAAAAAAALPKLSGPLDSVAENKAIREYHFPVSSDGDNTPQVNRDLALFDANVSTTSHPVSPEEVMQRQQHVAHAAQIARNGSLRVVMPPPPPPPAPRKMPQQRPQYDDIRVAPPAAERPQFIVVGEPPRNAEAAATTAIVPGFRPLRAQPDDVRALPSPAGLGRDQPRLPPGAVIVSKPPPPPPPPPPQRPQRAPLPIDSRPAWGAPPPPPPAAAAPAAPHNTWSQRSSLVSGVAAAPPAPTATNAAGVDAMSAWGRRK